MGLKQRWKANDLNELSPAEKQKLQREWAEARQRREQERFEGHRRVAVEAQTIWAACAAASPDHPYLLKKLMRPENIGQVNDRLVVPMYDIHGDIWKLQRIAPDGAKRFMRSEEHTSELQSLMRRSYAVFCLK